MATATAEHYRAYTPKPFTRAERDSTTILFGGLHWRLERVLQAVLENGGHHAAGAARGHPRGSPHRARGRRHRPVLPDELHHGQPRQLPQEEVGRDRRRRGVEEVRLPDGGLLRRLPLRPVPPELRAGPAQLRPRRLPHVPDGPGPDGPEGGHGRRHRPEPADDARLSLGHLLHRPRAGPRVPGAAVRGRARPDERRGRGERRAALRGAFGSGRAAGRTRRWPGI